MLESILKDKISISGNGEAFSGWIKEANWSGTDGLVIKVEILDKISNEHESTIKELHSRASKLEEESLSYLSIKRTHMAHTKMDQAKCLRVAANNLDNVSAA